MNVHENYVPWEEEELEPVDNLVDMMEEYFDDASQGDEAIYMTLMTPYLDKHCRTHVTKPYEDPRYVLPFSLYAHRTDVYFDDRLEVWRFTSKNVPSSFEVAINGIITQEESIKLYSYLKNVTLSLSGRNFVTGNVTGKVKDVKTLGLSIKGHVWDLIQIPFHLWLQHARSFY